jgi:hypothetical protein
MHPCAPHNCAWPPDAEQSPRFLQPIGPDIGLQQREFDQIVLRAATANPFVLPRQRRQRFERAGKIAAFEGREAPNQRGKVRARRVTPLSGQLLYSTSTGMARRIISHDSLHKQHMQISEPTARPRQCVIR